MHCVKPDGLCPPSLGAVACASWCGLVHRRQVQREQPDRHLHLAFMHHGAWGASGEPAEAPPCPPAALHKPTTSGTQLTRGWLVGTLT